VASLAFCLKSFIPYLLLQYIFLPTVISYVLACCVVIFYNVILVNVEDMLTAFLILILALGLLYISSLVTSQG
jgi:hypothetical protein